METIPEQPVDPDLEELSVGMPANLEGDFGLNVVQKYKVSIVSFPRMVVDV